MKEKQNYLDATSGAIIKIPIFFFCNKYSVDELYISKETAFQCRFTSAFLAQNVVNLDLFNYIIDTYLIIDSHSLSRLQLIEFDYFYEIFFSRIFGEHHYLNENIIIVLFIINIFLFERIYFYFYFYKLKLVLILSASNCKQIKNKI